jgi:hypothetical protein
MKIFAVVMTLLAGFASPDLAGTAVASSPPVLSWVTLPGYPAAIASSSWAPDVKVGFALSQRGLVFGVEVRTTAKGTFEIGIRKFQCNFGGVAQAQNLAGVRAMAPVLDPCGPAVTPTMPVLVVIQGHRLRPKVAVISGLGHGRSTSIVQGNAISLWEKGKTHPEFVATAPAGHFFLIGYGPSPAPSCVSANCAPGFSWEWIGTRAGHTDIAVAPWCGTNPCPQYVVAIPITILPAPAANQTSLRGGAVSE